MRKHFPFYVVSAIIAVAKLAGRSVRIWSKIGKIRPIRFVRAEADEVHLRFKRLIIKLFDAVMLKPVVRIEEKYIFSRRVIKPCVTCGGKSAVFFMHDLDSAVFFLITVANLSAIIG